MHPETKEYHILLHLRKKTICHRLRNHFTGKANQRAQIAAPTTALTENQQRVSSLESNASIKVTIIGHYQDCITNITVALQINLEIFKTLANFADRKQYCSWRKSAWMQKENTKEYATTPRFYTAFSIVDSKIHGEPSHILINQTKFNFHLIINHIDYTYADQRHLYVLPKGVKK